MVRNVERLFERQQQFMQGVRQCLLDAFRRFQFVALGAAVSRPGSELWMVFGDGAFGYSAIEFDTFVRHRVPVIAVIGNDAGWTQIAREQVKMLNDDVGTVLARTDYHRVAEGFGAHGIVVKHDAELPAALAEARQVAASGRPVLLNVWLARSDFREGSLSM